MSKLNFDEHQTFVIKYYVNGEFDHLEPDDIPECGDGLLKFLLTELSESEGCDSIEEAARRLDGAIRELQDLRREMDNVNGIITTE